MTTMKRIFSCSLAILIGSLALHAQQTNKKMNVIFYLVDDLGWTDLGYEGSSFYETPNIDSFSKVGVRFNQAYAACHVCSPSRASILTGEYPARLHLTDWLPGRKDFPFQKLQNVHSEQHLPYDGKTLPMVLKEHGYRTAIYGKWHLGEDPNSTSRQGFDVHVPDYNKGWPNGSYFSPYDMKGLEGGVKGEYLTDRLTSEALKWVEQNKDHPFFLYLAHYAVHDPIQGRGDLVVKYEKKLAKTGKPKGAPFILEGNPDDGVDVTGTAMDEAHKGFRVFPDRTVKIKQHQDNVQFAAMVDCMDENFGRVMAKLKQLGLEDNTIVIFFSDNGGMSAANFGNPARNIQPVGLDKAYSTSNLPLRGGKGWMYEGGIREPLLIYWPHHGEHGVTSDVPVVGTDFYSTILDMVGIDPSPRGLDGIDGKSLVPILKGDKAAADALTKRPLFWHFPAYSNHGAQSPGGAVRLGDYKLIEYYENNRVQLFNLKNDPGEQHDLSKTEPAKVTELTGMLHDWRKKVNAQMPVPNPKYVEGSKWPGTGIKGEGDSPYDTH
ncbi:MAG: sulfatase [Bacteroidetes bacterium]|nr:sulfatase [Bacteroidota bacterium]